ncbi:MAG: peroxiredoxin [Verrucomicrobia bacterium]|nr:peroxiredoxin [Verrucomicrobiota bacterium]
MSSSTELKVGDSAPDFTATALGGAYGTEGQRVQKRDFAGRYVVLYFYPKDDTPGCTIQACGLRDRWPDFQGKDAAVFGVSTDPLTSHREFIAKYGLPFPLLSDEEKRMVQDYGVWVEKNYSGQISMGTERSTFVIDPAGNIAAIFRRVNPQEHAAQVLAALGEKAE